MTSLIREELKILTTIAKETGVSYQVYKNLLNQAQEYSQSKTTEGDRLNTYLAMIKQTIK